MSPPYPVSVHGGHSGQFCNHAKNTLEEMIIAYVDHGYRWVGITEHMPPVSDHFLYSDEIEAGLNAKTLQKRFGDYISVGRELQSKYEKYIRIYVGFETEDYTGSLDLAKKMIKKYSPDYVVGSIHHVNDIPFDYNKNFYRQAAQSCGSADGLYATYFDQQYKMIGNLRPKVVGHMDIIRIHDPDYRNRLVKPDIWKKIVRNLALIKELDLILDFNLRPLSRGEKEPYLSAPILTKACKMGIDIVPGDDSHKVADIDAHMHRAIDCLRAAGGKTNWRKPVDER